MLIIVIFSDADIGTFGQSRTSCPLTLREITVFFFIHKSQAKCHLAIFTPTVCWFFPPPQHKHGSRRNRSLLNLEWSVTGFAFCFPNKYQSELSLCFLHLVENISGLITSVAKIKWETSSGYSAISCAVSSCFSLHCLSVTQEACLLWCHFL